MKSPRKKRTEISKKVKENRGSEGIDEVSLKEFEADLDNNLLQDLESNGSRQLLHLQSKR